MGTTTSLEKLEIFEILQENKKAKKKKILATVLAAFRQDIAMKSIVSPS